MTSRKLNFDEETKQFIALYTNIKGEEIEKVFNKQGSTYRQLPEEIKLALNDPQKAFEFLLEKNSAIKRPILVDKNKMIAGFNELELDKWLNI